MAQPPMQKKASTSQRIQIASASLHGWDLAVFHANQADDERMNSVECVDYQNGSRMLIMIDLVSNGSPRIHYEWGLIKGHLLYLACHLSEPEKMFSSISSNLIADKNFSLSVSSILFSSDRPECRTAFLMQPEGCHNVAKILHLRASGEAVHISNDKGSFQNVYLDLGDSLIGMVGSVEEMAHDSCLKIRADHSKAYVRGEKMADVEMGAGTRSGFWADWRK